jgi:hypothetical protein
MSELTPVRRERIQSKLTRLILKDEEQEKINQLIKVNELNDEDAGEMVRIAKKERVDIIRGLCMKNLYLGCLIMILGIGSVYAFGMVVGMVTKPILILAAVLVVLGLCKVVEGVVGIALAPRKKGAVESE